MRRAFESEVSAGLASDIAATKAEIQAAETELREELDDLIYDARNAGHSAFPAKLKCGCSVKLVRDWMEGDTIAHTKRKWVLCETHERFEVDL